MGQFEKDIAHLEMLLKTMESGTLSLEDNLKSFEEGIALIRTTQKQLLGAEQKVSLYNKDAELNTDMTARDETA